MAERKQYKFLVTISRGTEIQDDVTIKDLIDDVHSTLDNYMDYGAVDSVEPVDDTTSQPAG